nr:hypothetical protein [Gammaproteobacteria bacterium]
LDLLKAYRDGDFFNAIDWHDTEQFHAYFKSSQAWLTDLEWLDRQVRINYFKRVQAPPIIVLSKRAFGYDLRESQLPHYEPRQYAALRAEVVALPCGGGSNP